VHPKKEVMTAVLADIIVADTSEIPVIIDE
jgi:hypothetical protein